MDFSISLNEEGKLTALRNTSPSRWRYEFKTLYAESTEVTQYMECFKSPGNLAESEISWAAKAMAKTLLRFKEQIELLLGERRAS
jgi:hypothetical protein